MNTANTIFNAALFNSTSANRLYLVNQYLQNDSEIVSKRSTAQQEIDQLAAQSHTDKNTLACLGVIITLPMQVLKPTENEVIDERQPVAGRKDLRAKRLVKVANAVLTIQKSGLLVDGLITAEPVEESVEEPTEEPTEEAIS